MRKCKRIGGVAVMEVAHVGAKTRGVEASSAGSTKRRKIVCGELESSSLNSHLSGSIYMVNSPEGSISPATSVNFGKVVTGDPCSSNDSCELVNHRCRSVDLETDGLETETSMYGDSRYSRETTALLELCADSEDLESAAKPSPAKRRQRQTAQQMPSKAEIEEFFDDVEKLEQKRLTEKYNYDFVNDVPLDGRYDWVRLKP